jgi:hypothetical protein
MISTRFLVRTARVASAFAGALALLCASHAAHANGRYPQADQLLIAANQPEFLVLRTTFGFLVSHDWGRNWDFICERAIGYSGAQDPTIGLMANGTIIAGLAEGISRSSDQGCGWAFSNADLGDSPVIDLTVRRDAAHRALALVWDAQTLGYSSRILASEDNGQSFLPYGSPIDGSVLVTTIDIASSKHVYASGTRSVDGVRTGLLFTSDDEGKHWNEYPVPLIPKVEEGVYIAGVDPEDADTVYLRTSSATVGRLLVSHDAGKTVAVIYSGSLLSFALSPDGRQLYFGGEDGLHGGLATDLQFEKRSSVRLLCLAATADTVYACSDERSGFTVGASGDGGFTFEPLLHLKTVRGPLNCNAAECARDWTAVRAQLGIQPPSESAAGAGAAASDDPGPDADAGNPAAVPTPRASHSSCAVALCTSGRSDALALLAIALARVIRRKSRGSSRPRAK